MLLIREADPQSHVIRSYVRPHFSKPNKCQAKTMFATGETVGLVEWIIDDTSLVLILYFIDTEQNPQCFSIVN